MVIICTLIELSFTVQYIFHLLESVHMRLVSGKNVSLFQK